MLMRKGSFLRPGGSKKEVAEAADVGIVHGRRDSVNLWSSQFRDKLQPKSSEDAKDDIKSLVQSRTQESCNQQLAANSITQGRWDREEVHGLWAKRSSSGALVVIWPCKMQKLCIGDIGNRRCCLDRCWITRLFDYRSVSGRQQAKARAPRVLFGTCRHNNLAMTTCLVNKIHTWEAKRMSCWGEI